MDDTSDHAASEAKRARPESPNSPLPPIDSEELPEPKRRRVQGTADLVDSTEAKRVLDDLCFFRLIGVMDDTSDHAASEAKRARPESPNSPLPLIDSEELPEPKRRRVQETADSTEAKRIQDDLLDILDDPDAGSEHEPVIPDLDSVIKSFEEEIIVPGQQPTPSVLDLAPNAALNELGYLLEASDDELGLPPSFSNSVDENSNPKILDLPDISSSAFSMPFDGEMPNYDSFDMDPEINNNVSGKESGNVEFVMLGGLFDFADHCDVPEVMWRPESLPAV